MCQDGYQDRTIIVQLEAKTQCVRTLYNGSTIIKNPFNKCHQEKVYVPWET
jgi:hypothetical protein